MKDFNFLGILIVLFGVTIIASGNYMGQVIWLCVFFGFLYWPRKK